MHETGVHVFFLVDVSAFAVIAAAEAAVAAAASM